MSLQLRKNGEEPAAGHEHPHLRAATAIYRTILLQMGRTEDEPAAAFRALIDEVAASP